MPDPASNPQELLLELLRQKGILADQRNLRLAPFTNSSADDPNGANGAASIPAGSGAAPNSIANADTPQPIDNGDGTFTDPITNQVVSTEQAQSMWPAFFAGAGGAAMGYAASQLAKRRGVPVVEGQVVDEPERISNPREEVGEYTDVGEQSRGVGRTAEVADHPDGSPTSAKVLADRQRKLVAPKAALPSPKASDVSPEEMRRAEAIADELVKSRLLGNANPKLAPSRGVSTGSLDRQSLLESVIAAIRKAKINPSTLAKAIP